MTLNAHIGIDVFVVSSKSREAIRGLLLVSNLAASSINQNTALISTTNKMFVSQCVGCGDVH